MDLAIYFLVALVLIGFIAQAFINRYFFNIARATADTFMSLTIVASKNSADIKRLKDKGENK